MERDQIIDAVHLVQWKIWVNAVRPWCGRNQPSATNAAFEFITIEGIGPIHDELKVVEFSPLSITGGPCRFVGVHFVKSRIDTLLFRALEICLSPVFGVGRFSLVFIARLLPPAKGERGKANINIAVFH